MRSFIAFDLDDGVKERILEFSKKLKKTNADLKLIKKRNLHLTLKFPGDINNKQKEKVKNKLNSLSKKLEPFEIEFEGGGVFPNEEYIKVVWVGTGKGSKKVKEVNKGIQKSVKNMDVKESHHEYTPHITIARVKGGEGKDKILEIVEDMKKSKFGSQIFDKIKLKKSVLKGAGPIYSDMGVFDLR